MKDLNFTYFLCQKQYFIHSQRSFVNFVFTSQSKIKFAFPCNILCLKAGRVTRTVPIVLCVYSIFRVKSLSTFSATARNRLSFELSATLRAIWCCITISHLSPSGLLISNPNTTICFRFGLFSSERKNSS